MTNPVLLAIALRRLAVAIALAVVAASAATAQPPATPKAFVEEMSSTALKQLTASDLTDAERVKRFRKLLVENFDVPVVGKFVLGVHWRQTSEAQFKEFLRLYEIYVAHNYAGLFKKYKGETIDILKEEESRNGTYLVFGRINQPSGPPIAMEVRVHKNDSSFKVLDLKIEGVSMPLTHRKQFASVISRSRNGVNGLISALRRATDRFEAETPSQ